MVDEDASRPAPREAREGALTLLRQWDSRSGRTGDTVSLPVRFVRDARTERPPLAQMVSSGFGDVRLNVYLALVLRATQPPHDVKQNPLPRRWAEMLALSDPPGAGARRVRAAFRWLAERNWIETVPRVGRSPEVRLLNVSGDRTAFVPKGPRWVGVPRTLWTEGWVLELPARAVALLLVLLELQGGRSEQDQLYVDNQRRSEYGLSGDTWTRATHDLEHHKILTVRRMPLGDEYHPERRRNTFWVNVDRLRQSPWS